MSSRGWSRLPAALASIAVVGSLLLAGAGSVSAANTRVVYFGSPDWGTNPAANSANTVQSTCFPQTGQTAPSGDFWALVYPYGTGGCYNASGIPVAGQNSYSPVTSGGATATDIVIGNKSSSTLTQILVTGGKAAPATINAGSVPLMPTPPSGDHPIFNSDGTAATDSLPTGLYYAAVYVVSNPNNVSVPATPTACLSNSAGSTAPKGFFDSLSCPIGNLAAGQGVTLRVVVAVLSANVGTTEPWFELGLKEGSSNTGSNSDTFFTYSELTVGTASCTSATNYFLDTQQVDLSNQTGVAGSCAQATGLASGATIGGVGTLANILIRTPLQACPKAVKCFGDDSAATVLSGASVPGGLTWTITWTPLPISGQPKGVIHEHNDYDPANAATYDLIYFTGKYKCSSTLTTNCWISAGAVAGGYQAVFVTPKNGTGRGF